MNVCFCCCCCSFFLTCQKVPHWDDQDGFCSAKLRGKWNGWQPRKGLVWFCLIVWTDMHFLSVRKLRLSLSEAEQSEKTTDPLRTAGKQDAITLKIKLNTRMSPLNIDRRLDSTSTPWKWNYWDKDLLPQNAPQIAIRHMSTIHHSHRKGVENIDVFSLQ